MEQKHYMDIERVRYGNDLQTSNVDGFHAGDHIQVTEKIDGSNASVRYDAEANGLTGFSRKHELSEKMDLNGFYEYVVSLNPEPFKEHPDYIVFGEWLTKRTVKYEPEWYDKWYVYDVYDIGGYGYLPQDEVRAFCEAAGFAYIHVLYDGPFIDWDSVIQLASCPSAYGAEQMEGVVIKDQDRLNEPDQKKPFMLKYVNEAFAETKHSNHIRKPKNPQDLQARAEADAVTETIVTPRRVEKEIQKMQDENLLPDQISPKDIGMIAKMLPGRIQTDCIKEEPELVDKAGGYFTDSCRKLTMEYVRRLILG